MDYKSLERLLSMQETISTYDRAIWDIWISVRNRKVELPAPRTPSCYEVLEMCMAEVRSIIDDSNELKKKIDVLTVENERQGEEIERLAKIVREYGNNTRDETERNS